MLVIVVEIIDSKIVKRVFLYWFNSLEIRLKFLIFLINMLIREIFKKLNFI